MRFTKMHGLGNDFIVIEAVEGVDYSELAVKLCDRHFGIGADGLLVVEPSHIADIKMRIFNADGSEAEMCGNGSRCFAKYVYEKGIVSKQKMTVETLAGVIMPELFVENGKVKSVKVYMGSPIFESSKIPVKSEKQKFIDEPVKIDGKTYRLSSVRVGVPHTILFVSSFEESFMKELGPKIEKSSLFPEGTNVDFVKVEDEENISVRTWERGVGLTLACGSGASASAVVSSLLGRTRRSVNVHFKAGVLLVEWKEDNSIYLSGEVEEVFRGEIEI
ncbi:MULTISPECIES: diaminopimelate epimerase [Caldanaerobacter]|uniref:Diaminopimelate epimerase n=2 Tax=Caldanaerobacter subterraneus TaxID=911092 RepID=A0A357VM87_9THEO|nr:MULTISPECIES: diaminopimelate epimerase [Caldanaerobacter]ERM92379.1 diaminopimelate epimerase [Caldanaerobacter subterraneus subsp. yonseiensis KB-1]NNG66214.1 diaminopimelate epimerase [Caldanaerobacter subterraneus]TCO67870.1 diaminopimelate epimerase [Caldanaerobacter subterraneus]HBT49494.1 diaminopimelate epimerase [Caldanaerobacter subterraneus]